VTFLDFRESAPAAMTPALLTALQMGPPPADAGAPAAPRATGPSVGVPGEPRGIEEMLRRFGTLGLARVVAPAARLAEEGFTPSEHLAGLSQRFVGALRRDPLGQTWVPDGADGIRANVPLRNPALARTLENRIGVACELIDPFRGVQVDPKLFNLDYINQVRPLAAVVLGLGLRKAGDFRINLLPVKEARKRESGKQFLALMGIALLILVGVMYYWQSETEAELARIEGQNNKITAQLKEAEAKSKQIALMQAEKDELEKQKVVLDGLLDETATTSAPRAAERRARQAFASSAW
jgi:hypothetical protein